MSIHGRRGRDDISPRRVVGLGESIESDLMASKTSIGAGRAAAKVC
jgi:hypothetical protein